MKERKRGWDITGVLNCSTMSKTEGPGQEEVRGLDTRKGGARKEGAWT